jgi:ribonucleoside-diphosphate reductase alpha chain
VNREEDGTLFEVFLSHGKAGGCAQSQCEAIGRLVAYSLRIGGDAGEIVKELKGISCHSRTEKIYSCSDAVAKILEKEIGE